MDNELPSEDYAVPTVKTLKEILHEEELRSMIDEEHTDDEYTLYLRNLNKNLEGVANDVPLTLEFENDGYLSTIKINKEPTIV